MFPDADMPMGTDEKFAEDGDAALVIRPDEQTTWEMYVVHFGGLTSKIGY